MFVDVSFFEVEEGRQRDFEREFGSIVVRARDAQGCHSSDLVKLDEERRYAWIERWATREEHNNFTELLFAHLLPALPDFGRYATRIVDRDAEDYVVV